jgi:hypothetical protein
MSEWNYTKCTKPFESAEHAKEYMLEHDFAGWVLKRAEGFSAVCPAYPAGYDPDATVVDQVENSLHELAHASPDAVPSCCWGSDRSHLSRASPREGPADAAGTAGLEAQGVDSSVTTVTGRMGPERWRSSESVCGAYSPRQHSGSG